jgi:hypothetical protein
MIVRTVPGDGVPVSRGIVVVDGDMAMTAGAVVVVAVNGAVLVGTAVDAVPVYGALVASRAAIARVAIACRAPQAHRVRMGVDPVPMRVAMLDQTRGRRRDREPGGEGEDGAADAVRRAPAEEAEVDAHRTAVAESRRTIWMRIKIAH